MEGRLKQSGGSVYSTVSTSPMSTDGFLNYTSEDLSSFATQLWQYYFYIDNQLSQRERKNICKEKGIRRKKEKKAEIFLVGSRTFLH